MGEKGKRQVETARKIGKQREASNGLGRGKGLVRLLLDLLRSPISFTFSPTFEICIQKCGMKIYSSLQGKYVSLV